MHMRGQECVTVAAADPNYNQISRKMRDNNFPLTICINIYNVCQLADINIYTFSVICPFSSTQLILLSNPLLYNQFPSHLSVLRYALADDVVKTAFTVSLVSLTPRPVIRPILSPVFFRGLHCQVPVANCLKNTMEIEMGTE